MELPPKRLPGSFSTQRRLPTPAMSDKTSLPKQVLSYRWVIKDADMFLLERNRELSLESSTFSTFSPLSSVKYSWRLLFERDRYYPMTRKNSIRVCHSGGTLGVDASRLWISGCTFSFLNPDTYESEYSVTAPCNEVSANGVCIDQVLEGEKVMKCIFDGTLTIQVNADLLCTSDSEETVKCAIPMDDIRNEMHSLYKAEVLTDTTLKCGQKEFKVHRAVLGSQSPVFKAMLQADMKEKRSNVVDIPDIAPAVMSDLVAYLYTGTAPNVVALAKELLDAANKYQLRRLFTMCENELKMKITVGNVVDTLLLADLHSATKLKGTCLFFIRKHSADVYETKMWKYLKKNLDQYAALVMEAMN